MLIGKFFAESTSRDYWVEANSFDELCDAMINELDNWGANSDEFNPAKLTIYSAQLMKLIVTYELKPAN
jgi:hypothetical protein